MNKIAEMGCEVIRAHESIECCQDSILFNIGLTPGQTYFFSITDRHGNRYSQEFVADEDGNGTLSNEGLPEDLFHQENYGLQVSIVTDLETCTPVPMKIRFPLDSITVDFRGIKKEVGC